MIQFIKAGFLVGVFGLITTLTGIYPVHMGLVSTLLFLPFAAIIIDTFLIGLKFRGVIPKGLVLMIDYETKEGSVLVDYRGKGKELLKGVIDEQKQA